MFSSASLYITIHRVFHAVHAGIEILFEGFWMGLLGNSVIDEVTQLSYGDGHQYTTDRYLDTGLQFWEKIAVDRFFAPGCRVLIGAAGGGREMIALARAGYRVDGFECSRAMVAAGQHALSSRGIAARLAWAAPCQLPATCEDIYDAAIIGWNGYTYMAPRSRRVAFLKNLRPLLRAGAPILVSGALTVAKSRRHAWTPRIANAVRLLTLRAPAFEYGDSLPGRPRHNFTRFQLECELTEAGFSPAAFLQWGAFGACVGQSSTSPADTPI